MDDRRGLDRTLSSGRRGGPPDEHGCERRLNSLDGVTATVNYATEQARVISDGADPADLVAAVEAAGYRARVVPAAGTAPADVDVPAPVDETTALRQRLVVSAVLSAPVLLLSMIPALQFTSWQWLALALSGPVVVWGALPLHRAAGPTPATVPQPWTR